MTEQAWGVDENSPMNEGSDDTAVHGGSVAERKAAEHPTAQDGTDLRPSDTPPAYDSDEEHQPQAGVQGGQPNLTPDPAVSGRRSNFSPGATDDSPGTPSVGKTG
jgi:hypothetical protein